MGTKETFQKRIYIYNYTDFRNILRIGESLLCLTYRDYTHEKGSRICYGNYLIHRDKIFKPSPPADVGRMREHEEVLW